MIPCFDINADSLSLEDVQILLFPLFSFWLYSLDDLFGTNKKVKWSSTKTSVCTVTSAGVVTAVGVGTCNIKVTTANGSLVATCKVTVI